jgi:cellulose synthase/poly-beta-1,6-N-acetylglucosamine synthase-like glycosyltransferase
MWTTIAFVSTAALFVGLTLTTLRHQRWARRLPALEALPAPAELDGLSASAVGCSVIVAARDEEARLEATVRHLLAQRHVALEVIVVDDRSIDYSLHTLRRASTVATDRRSLRTQSVSA